jgi:hypothetical protein
MAQRLPYDPPRVYAQVHTTPLTLSGCSWGCCGLCSSRFHAVRGRLRDVALNALGMTLGVSELVDEWWSRLS